MSAVLRATALACAFAVEPGTAEQFVDAFRAAHGRGDKAALLALVHWEGLGSEQRAINEQLMTAALSAKIAEIALEPLRPGEADDYTLDGVRYRLNAEPQAVMELRPDQWSDRPASMSFIVGTRRGAYKIASAAPLVAVAARPVPAAASHAMPARLPTPAAPQAAVAPEQAPEPVPKTVPLPRALRRACASEIGILCYEQRGDGQRLLGCLQDKVEFARKACRRALAPR